MHNNYEPSCILSDTLITGKILLVQMEQIPRNALAATCGPQAFDEALLALSTVVEVCLHYPLGAFSDEEVDLVHRISHFCANTIHEDLS